jgi:hypothetical protein
MCVPKHSGEPGIPNMHSFNFVSVEGGRVLRRIFGPKRDEVTGGW